MRSGIRWLLADLLADRGDLLSGRQRQRTRNECLRRERPNSVTLRTTCGHALAAGLDGTLRSLRLQVGFPAGLRVRDRVDTRYFGSKPGFRNAIRRRVDTCRQRVVWCRTRTGVVAHTVRVPAGMRLWPTIVISAALSRPVQRSGGRSLSVHLAHNRTMARAKGIV